jgi:hypothetical protein
MAIRVWRQPSTVANPNNRFSIGIGLKNILGSPAVINYMIPGSRIFYAQMVWT